MVKSRRCQIRVEIAWWGVSMVARRGGGDGRWGKVGRGVVIWGRDRSDDGEEGGVLMMLGVEGRKRKEMETRVGVMSEVCDETNWWALNNK